MRKASRSTECRKTHTHVSHQHRRPHTHRHAHATGKHCLSKQQPVDIISSGFLSCLQSVASKKDETQAEAEGEKNNQRKAERLLSHNPMSPVKAVNHQRQITNMRDRDVNGNWSQGSCCAHVHRLWFDVFMLCCAVLQVNSEKISNNQFQYEIIRIKKPNDSLLFINCPKPQSLLDFIHDLGISSSARGY